MLLVRPFNPDLKMKAEVELNETPKKLEEGIKHLKEWISKQPHLRARTDDQWLAAFLRGCKHSLERAKEKIDLYYSLRTLAPDMFSLRPKDERFKYLLRTGIGGIPDRYRDNLVKWDCIDPLDYVSDGRPCSNMSYMLEYPKYPYACILEDLMSATDAAVNVYPKIPEYKKVKYLEDDAFMVNGCINIIDLDGITMAHFAQMTPTVVKKLIVAGQDASPLRVKGVYFINTMPAFERIFNLVIKLLNEKHQKRLHMYSKDLTTLHKHVPLEIWPKEYGGEGGTKQEIIDFWLKKFDDYGDWFDEDLKFGTDESKRPGKPKTTESMFGVQGSFRRLDVD